MSSNIVVVKFREVNTFFSPRPNCHIKAINAVASIKAISGEVKIERLKRNIPGRKGLVLNDKDIVITGHRAKTTILFRDGSEIRLFQNSRSHDAQPDGYREPAAGVAA